MTQSIGGGSGGGGGGAFAVYTTGTLTLSGGDTVTETITTEQAHQFDLTISLTGGTVERYIQNEGVTAGVDADLHSVAVGLIWEGRLGGWRVEADAYDGRGGGRPADYRVHSA